MRTFWLTLYACLFAAVVSAQSPTIQPTQLQFTASTDHTGVITGTSTPLLTNYTVNVLAGATQVLTPVSLGKPTPDASNQIVVQLSSIAGFLSLAKNTVYTATVAAVGPGGTQASAPSNFFVLVGPPAAPGTPVVKP